MWEEFRGFGRLIGVDMADHVPLSFVQIAERLGFDCKFLNAILAENAKSCGIGLTNLLRRNSFCDPHQRDLLGRAIGAARRGMYLLPHLRDVFADGHKRREPLRTLRYTKENSREQYPTTLSIQHGRGR